ncbi:MAG: matrixin family metalloprotease [Gemmatimonadota bacterium]
MTDLLLRHDAANGLQAAIPGLSAPDSGVSPDQNPTFPMGHLATGRSSHIEDDRQRSSALERLTGAGSQIYLDSLLSASDSVLRRWPEAPGRPLTVAVMPPADEPLVTDLADDVQRALEGWTGLGLGFRFATTPDTTDADIVVRWVSRLQKNRTGQTDLTWDQLGAVRHSSILLALRGPDGALLDQSARRTVALHEMGHALGLPHSADPGDVMYPASRQSGLSRRDRETLSLLYSLPFGSLHASVRHTAPTN